MPISTSSLVATLVAHPDRPGVTDTVIDETAQALGHETRPAVLARGIAVDLVFEASEDPAVIQDRLRHALAPAPVDVVVQPLAGRKKKLFLADMDSTMIEQECIDELADFVGLKGEVATITERAMRGEIAFEPALRERVALLKGLPLKVVDDIIEQRITLTSGGRALVRTMRANGAYTCLVSGGFTVFTGPISGMVGFDEHRSNRLIVENEHLAGRVEEPILGREAKLSTLHELRERLRLSPTESLAVGDGANDLAMLSEAGLGVAFHAKPAVAAAAHARLDHADLTALLYVQGYRAEDFVLDG
ncbi:phosphoserine phosphatase SerB [Microvirga massiliensis]|uniref:phosphoserine phosphatase SerB n=1 Tax=Microvirga massiliensis TaxID=1033741 RepID=UPI00062B7AEE|nr:phosphoserine phosphatase SerB [Microvirga massiliensis]